ncbi:MAG: sigma-54 dependent transcriptional regulator [Bacteroidales bacterium]|nr:sigma-54 dependent transcriptional regulator [Bacteroidales bacterium]
MENLKILIVDDEKSYRTELCEFLENYDFKAFTASSPSEAFKILEYQDIDIVILDIRLPEMDGLEVLERIKKDYHQIEVIMISGHGDMPSVVKAMRLGAIDFFSKPFKLNEVLTSIERTKRFLAISIRLREVESNFQLVTRKLNEIQVNGIIGDSKSIKVVTDLVSKVAASDTTSVLIIGESGTGKELIAKAIHYLSPRKDNYFYAVNSSAITETLFESEFFGHAKGSFTGASENKTGWFEVSNKGTLFLDEIGDLPMGLQTKFLRVLEERKINRVGAHKEIDIDVRIIAATNQNLEKLTEQRLFRLDLYHRLSSFIIHLPALRDRKEDIPQLLYYFTDEFAKKLSKKILGVDDSVIELLSRYSFPGNVRELRNMAERAVILCDGDHLQTSHFQLSRIEKSVVSDDMNEDDNLDLDFIEKNTIIRAIRKSAYNKSAAARILGITYQSLDRRIKKFDLKFEKHLS